MPNAVRVASRADDGDGMRLQDPRDAVHARCPGAPLARRQRASRGLDVEGEMYHAVLDGSALTPKPGCLKDLEHSPVVDQRLGSETRDAVTAGIRREIFEQEWRKSASLMFVGNRKRDLSLVAAGKTFVATDGNHVLAKECDERHAVVVVDRREMRDLAIGQLHPGTEKPEVHALLGLAREKGAMRVSIVGPDRANVDRAAICQDGIDRPRRRVARGQRFTHEPIISSWPPATDCLLLTPHCPPRRPSR